MTKRVHDFGVGRVAFQGGDFYENPAAVALAFLGAPVEI
jgi:hypothetical protein